MADETKLNHPWLVAVWPGMGGVALSAGYYLIAKLGMHAAAEMEGGDLFDVDHVEVKDGLVLPGRRPRNLVFIWPDPEKKRDLVIFLGEAQPVTGKYRFCKRIIDYARDLGVERVFTFAAMATQMHPRDPSRVFGVSTDAEGLAQLKRLEVELLRDGQIGGLNGVLLAAAADGGLRGTCLLGEMPHFFTQLPFPKASVAVLETFTTITGLDVDFTELAEQARSMEDQLGEILSRVEQAARPPAEEEEYSHPSAEDEHIGADAQQQIERLFEEARADRSKAFELKRELDRLGVFKEYEDRFLNLFKKNGGSNILPSIQPE
jgi:proteasome assembly chaperone (PAC2) family protein